MLQCEPSNRIRECVYMHTGIAVHKVKTTVRFWSQFAENKPPGMWQYEPRGKYTPQRIFTRPNYNPIFCGNVLEEHTWEITSCACKHTNCKWRLCTQGGMRMKRLQSWNWQHNLHWLTGMSFKHTFQQIHLSHSEHFKWTPTALMRKNNTVLPGCWFKFEYLQKVTILSI